MNHSSKPARRLGLKRYVIGPKKDDRLFLDLLRTLCVFFGHQRCTRYHRVRAMKTHAAVIKCTQGIYEGSFDIMLTQAHACYGVLYMTIGLNSDWTYAFNTYLQVQRARSIQRKHSSFEHI